MSDDLNGVMRGVMVVMFLGVGLVICAKTDERAKICLSTQSIDTTVFSLLSLFIIAPYTIGVYSETNYYAG